MLKIVNKLIEKRLAAKIATLDAKINSLKVHEATLVTKITDKEAEITASTDKAVTDLHEATKDKIFAKLVKIVSERSNVELKLIKWY